MLLIFQLMSASSQSVIFDRVGAETPKYIFRTNRTVAVLMLYQLIIGR